MRPASQRELNLNPKQHQTPSLTLQWVIQANRLSMTVILSITNVNAVFTSFWTGRRREAERINDSRKLNPELSKKIKEQK
jgi:hypothetical protein